MTLQITINLDNAAFTDNGVDYELRRIFGKIADHAGYDGDRLNNPLYDSNGNFVGYSKSVMDNQTSAIEPREIIVTVRGGVVQNVDGIPSRTTVKVLDYDDESDDECVETVYS